jgi:hypothetical protein
MSRAHGVLALLLAAALAWAYALTRPEWWPAGDADRPVLLWTLDARDVLSVEYSEGGSRVALKSDATQRLPDGAPAWWIDAEGPAAAADAPPAPLQRPQPGKPAAPATPAHPAGPGAKPAAPGAKSAPPDVSARPQPGAAERASFRGGMAAANLVRELARLPALREIGRVDARQLQAFGLDKPVGTLRIERAAGSAEAARGEPLRLDLGIATVGGGTRYAALQPAGRVFIIPQGALRQMEHARRLMDHEWLSFNLIDAKRIEARMGKRTLTLWRLDLPPAAAQRWARKSDAAQGEPAAQAWVQTLAGVKVLDYSAAGALPLGPEPVLEITVHRGPPPKPIAGAPAGGAASAPGAAPPASGQAASAEPPDQPVVLRVYPAGGKAGGKGDAERLSAVSTYTSTPVAVSGSAVKAVLDQARALLDSH